MFCTVSLINTMDESKATWEYLSGRLIEEVRSKNLSENAYGKTATVTSAVVRRGDYKSHISCYRCNKKGHIARYCKRNIR